MPRARVRGRLAKASSTVFFSSPAKLFSNRDSTGNSTLRIPSASTPTRAPAEKAIQGIAPVAAAFHSFTISQTRQQKAARKTAVGRIPPLRFVRKTLQNRCQECFSPRRKARKDASYRAAKEAPAVTRGTHPTSQNRLRKMQSVTWVMVIIRPLSGLKSLENMAIPPVCILDQYSTDFPFCHGLFRPWAEYCPCNRCTDGFDQRGNFVSG